MKEEALQPLGKLMCRVGGKRGQCDRRAGGAQSVPVRCLHSLAKSKGISCALRVLRDAQVQSGTRRETLASLGMSRLHPNIHGAQDWGKVLWGPGSK